MRAFVFPGQGSQKIGMGRDLAETFAAARDVFNEIDDALDALEDEVECHQSESEEGRGGETSSTGKRELPSSGLRSCSNQGR